MNLLVIRIRSNVGYVPIIRITFRRTPHCKARVQDSTIYSEGGKLQLAHSEGAAAWCDHQQPRRGWLEITFFRGTRANEAPGPCTPGNPPRTFALDWLRPIGFSARTKES